MLISAPSSFEKRDVSRLAGSGAGSGYARALLKGSRRTPRPVSEKSEVIEC
jgi:hypothetical protein